MKRTSKWWAKGASSEYEVSMSSAKLIDKEKYNLTSLS